MALYLNGKKIVNSLVVDGKLPENLVLSETATGQTYTFTDDFEGYVLIIGRDSQTITYDAPTISVQEYYMYFGNVKVYYWGETVTEQRTFIYCKAQSGDYITINDYYSDGEFYLFKSIKGGLNFEEYLEFNGEYINLPITLNSNHRVYCEFQLNEYVSGMQILGNSAGNTSNFYVGLWNGVGANNFYVRTSDGEHYRVLSDYTAKHTLDVNNNGKVLVDGVEWYSGVVNTNSNTRYTIGYRNATDYTGKIFRFYIYDTVNDEYLCDLRPVAIKNTHCMYDIINEQIYTKDKR